MGIYLNPGDELFQEAIRSEIYVDKTGLLNYTNKVLRTSRKYLCVSRPRRFGKSMAANMVAIQQIKDRRYGKALEDYTGKILAVGVSYDRETRKHKCLIEEYDINGN